MILMLAWCWISSTWAVDFSIAIRRLTLTTITFWTLFLCVEHAGYERTIRMMRWLLLITLVIDYMNVMVSPLAIETASDAAEQAIAGSWRGIQAQKNFAGAVCAILILLYLFGPKKSAALSHTVFKWGVIAAAAYFLHRTNSKTSMGVLAISILLGMVYSAFGSRNRLWLIPLLGSATLLAGILAVQNSQTLYDPAAFTGRSQIWLVVLHYIREHLWLGSGFGTFWNIGSISPVYHYTHSWVAKVASGHNGYLDLVAQIGLPGFVLTMIAMVLQPVRILLSNTAIPSQRGALLVAIFFFCIGHNFTESTILTTSVILELILVIVLALIFQAGRAGLATAIEPVPAPRGYAQIASPRLAR
jgi:O-antigen ligase